jgi:glycosyltransferase involved in cell wall biosynthesis
MKLTILMPCLNEAETLAICIEKAKKWIQNSGLNSECEVLVADNGSTDGSQSIAKALGARVVDVDAKGYGNALYFGSIAAKGHYIIMGDSDDSYDFSSLSIFLEKLEQGYDLVMGNRFLGGIAPGAMPWKNRYIGNPILTWIGRLLFACPAKDFHCGLRGYTKNAFLSMDLRTTGMEFASEMVIKANLFGMRITEVPTTLSKDGRSRPPHLRPWRDGWRHLRFMLLFSPRWLFIFPGLFLFVTSLALYTSLLFFVIQLGNIRLGIHTLFYAEAGIVLGFLSIAIGLVIRLFGAREGLLGNTRMISSALDSPVLEIGGVAGLSMIILGFYLGLSSLISWGDLGFGVIAQGALLRTVSLSTLFIMLGGVLFMTSLIVGFLALPTKKQRD